MLEHFSYLAAILISICCLIVIDWRFKLAFYDDFSRTWKTILAIMAVFVLWDVLGIGLHIFFTASWKYLSGVRLAPNFPIEELGFLFLFVYTMLLLCRAGEKQ